MGETTEGGTEREPRADAVERSVDREAFERTWAAHEATPVATGIWSLDGLLLHANPVLRDLWAAPLIELVGADLLHYVGPTAEAEVLAMIADVWEGIRTSFECEMRCRDGEGDDLWLRARFHPVYGGNGRPSHLVSQIFDFVSTDWRPVSDDARPIPALLAPSPVMLWHADRQGRPHSGNRRTAEFFGLPEGTNELPESFLDVLHPDDETARDEHDSRISQREPFDLTARSRRADGEWRWLHHRVEPLFTTRGQLRGFAGVTHDVTDVQERMADLESVARLFESVTEDAPVALLRTDPEGTIIYANTRWSTLVNDADARLIGHGWHGVLVREHVVEVSRRAAASVITGESFTMRVRAHDASVADGKTAAGYAGRYWGELRVAPAYLEDGTHDGFVATIADVTAEVAERDRSDRLARVLDEGTDFLLMIDPDGTISYVNQAAEDELGLAAGPRGSGPTATGSGEDAPTFLMDILEPDSFTFFHEVVQPVLVEAQRWRGELTLIDTEGRSVPVSALVLAQRNDQHRIESTTVVARDISDLKQAQWRMRQLATHDYLTGLPNRVLLYERLDQALARHHRLGQQVALLYLDLDRFKPINDNLGHHVGDAVLVRLSDRIHSIVRDTDTAARIGGDEFAVLVEGYDSAELLEGVADRLISSISDPISVEGVTVQVGVSIGIVSADHAIKDADTLLARADAAMYTAKGQGRGRFVFAPPSDLDPSAGGADEPDPASDEHTRD